MGQNITKAKKDDRNLIDLSPEERALYTARFQKLDGESKGFVSINDLRRGKLII